MFPQRRSAVCVRWMGGGQQGGKSRLVALPYHGFCLCCCFYTTITTLDLLDGIYSQRHQCLQSAGQTTRSTQSGRDKAAQRCIPICHADSMSEGIQPHLPQHVLPASVAKHIVKVRCHAGSGSWSPTGLHLTRAHSLPASRGSCRIPGVLKQTYGARLSC